MVRRLRPRTHRLGWVIDRARLFWLVRGWARAGQADVVEVPDYLGWAAWWPRLGVPLLGRLNGSGSYFRAEEGLSARPRLLRIEGASLRRCDYWCSVSRYTAEKTKALLSLESEPCAILPNPVQLAPFTGVPARCRARVMFSGTLAPLKGIVPLIDAWTSVVAGRRDAELHIYGKDGRTYDKQPMWAYLSSRMGDPAALGVHYHGHVPRPELLQALTCARVAVFPSFIEGFANAPLEAMACGCPTIFTALASGPEVIEDGRDGILVNPREPAQIADAILRLLQDDDLAGRLSAAGYDRVRRDFSIERLLPMNEAMYADAIRSFAGSRSGPVATH